MNFDLLAADAPARILIVDDERPNRQLLEVMLRPEGFHLESASSGEEALALVLPQAKKVTQQARTLDYAEYFPVFVKMGIEVKILDRELATWLSERPGVRRAAGRLRHAQRILVGTARC